MKNVARTWIVEKEQAEWVREKAFKEEKTQSELIRDAIRILRERDSQ